MATNSRASQQAVAAQAHVRARHNLSLVERYRRGLALTAADADTSGDLLARQRRIAEQRRQLAQPIGLDGRGAVLRIDDGRVPFSKALTALGWSDDVELDAWVDNGRVHVGACGPDQPAPRGVRSRLDGDRRFLVPEPIRLALGVTDRDEVHLVIDRARALVIVESSRRLIARAYPDLYGSCDVECAAEVG